MNPAAVPTPVEDVHGDGRWMSLHNRFIAQSKEREPEVLFVGDSLVQQLAFTEFWNNMFVPMHCLNFGIGGDQTQNILWRLQNGELENIAPKVIVLLAGTNNHGHSSEQVTDGIVELVHYTTEKQPQAQVVVVGIPPRGQYDNPVRRKIKEINTSLEHKLASQPNCQFIDIDPSLFVNPQDGSISHLDMHDYLHFTPEGYQKLMEPVLEEVQNLLKNFLTADQISGGEPDN